MCMEEGEAWDREYGLGRTVSGIAVSPIMHWGPPNAGNVDCVRTLSLNLGFEHTPRDLLCIVKTSTWNGGLQQAEIKIR